ncbi:MAG: autotransporter domain-containing protein [Pelagimonas sp.]|uniref:autotransporter domain-containing protein n=1 Tax=Pelagimonas sp. TaxID=2073170 RepID=UPI003D6BF599
MPGLAWADENSDIAGAVTVNKALMADLVMNTTTAYLAGTPLDDAVVLAPVSPAQNSAPLPIEVDNILVVSTADGIPAIDVGVAGEVHVFNGGVVSSSGLASSAIEVDDTAAALSVEISGGARVATTGNNSAAINAGSFSNSVLNVNINSSGALAALSTTGDNATGIQMGDGTGNLSTATISIIGATTSTDGPGLVSDGADSDLIVADLVGQSSASVTIENSSLLVNGPESEILRLSLGEASDSLVLLDNSTLRSTGIESALVIIATADSGISNTAIVGSNLSATGAQSGGVGILTSGGDLHSDTTIVADSTLQTTGAALVLEAAGSGSTRTLVIEDSQFSSVDDASPAMLVGGVGDNSAADVTIRRSTISTDGDMSEALLLGRSGTGSQQTVIMEGVDLSTRGAASTALLINGASSQGELAFVAVGLDLATTGDNALGFQVAHLAGTDGRDAMAISDATISTTGRDAIGFSIGDETAPGAASNYTQEFAFAGFDISTLGDNATGVLLSFPSGDIAGSTFSFAAGDFVISTQGAHSAGLILGTSPISATGSLAASTLGGAQITTLGDHSSAFVQHGLGSNGSDNTEMYFHGDLTLSTQGENAIGYDLVGLGNDSRLALDPTVVSTMGDGSHGVRIAETGMGARQTVSLTGLEASTGGDNATALLIGGQRQSASILSLDMLNLSLATHGHGSQGFELTALPGSDSSAVISADQIVIDTQGDGADGFTLGAANLVAPNHAGTTNVSRTITLNNLDLTTSGDGSAGLRIAGIGDGATDSDQSTLITNTSVATSGLGSVGIDLTTFGSDAENAVAITAIETVDITTAGDNATGLRISGGGTGGNQHLLTHGLEDLTIVTTGAMATGIDLTFAGASMPNESVDVIATDLDVSVFGVGSDAMVITGTPVGSRPMSVRIDLEADDRLASADGYAFRETGMNTSLTVQGTVAGAMDFGTGSDFLTFAGADLDVTGLRGVDAGDGTDTLIFDQVSIDFTNTDRGFENFERMIFDDSNITLDGLDIAQGSTLHASGSSRLTGDVTGGGQISLNNGLATDVFTIDGDIRGPVTLSMDAILDSSEDADLLIVLGSLAPDVQGSIVINNIGGLGAPTGEEDDAGILLVEIHGQSDEANFALAGENLQAGAFIYGLHHSTAGDFYLQSTGGLSDAAHLYPKATDLVFTAHHTLTDLPRGLTSRQGVISSKSKTQLAPWVRVFGGTGQFGSETGRGDYSENSDTTFSYSGLQLGTGFELPTSAEGDLTVQMAAHYVTGAQSVRRSGDFSQNAGSFDTDAYGATVGFTYELPSYGYFETALSYSRAEFEFDTSSGAEADTTAKVVTWVAEAGRYFDLQNDLRLTPWARLALEQARVNGFTDSNGTDQDSYTVNHMLVSGGIKAEKSFTSARGFGAIYGGLGLAHYTSTGTDIRLQGVGIDDWRDNSTYAQIELGGRWQNEAGTSELSFDLASEHGLTDTSDHNLKVGFEVAFRF